VTSPTDVARASLLRGVLEGWRESAHARRRLHRKRDAGARADALRQSQLTTRHFVAWRTAWVVVTSARRVRRTKAVAFDGWRAEGSSRAALRLRLAERRRNASAAAAVRAWRAWRKHAAVRALAHCAPTSTHKQSVFPHCPPPLHIS
jgi:hypothetical protein